MQVLFRKAVIDMRILAVDQSRCGGWSLFDYKRKKLLDYGEFNFDGGEYKDYSAAVAGVKNLVAELIQKKKVAAVFIEDIQFQRNINSFKKLAWLQGVLVNYFVEKEYLYDIIAPSKWQNYCGARGRTGKEIKAGAVSVDLANKKKSKQLSLTFVKENFSVETENDGIADAICIGWYAVNNITINENKER